MSVEISSEQLSIADVAHKAAVAVFDLSAVEEAIGNMALQGINSPDGRPLEYIVVFDLVDENGNETKARVIGTKVFFWPADTPAEQSNT